MSKQVQEAYIVAATRTPVGKAPRGMFRNTRPDDLLVHALKSVLAQAPGLDKAAIGDVIIGCAMPEAEQGMNVARIALLLADLPNTVPGMTVNRFCSSGLQAVALAADRVYMLDTQDEEPSASLMLSRMNFGPLPMVNHLSRLAARFYQDEQQINAVRQLVGRKLSAQESLEAGLVTAAPDSLDWTDEIRLAIEGRAALSPDALTGLEANLRFGLPETAETRIFGRLSAWQNWIFSRPNAVGPTGALKTYGTGAPIKFDWGRV